MTPFLLLVGVSCFKKHLDRLCKRLYGYYKENLLYCEIFIIL